MNIEACRSRRVAHGRRVLASMVAFAWFVAVPLAVLPGAQSAGAEEAVSSTVSLAGLDLTTPTGLRKAQELLSATAHRLCHEYSDDNSAGNYATMTACYRETMGSAMQQLHAQVAVAGGQRTQLDQNKP